ncbi:hypothetical protein [Cronobacter phage EspYZU12]|nr:hypothetical protein EspYZU15_165 [Cronobacter phage EspYZU15]WAK45571.1 hypothetical protein EspYZU14_167 [Cronobacter phage EspYZU14]WBF78355.1 hypothetical protein [Cronobacter phage EspYZU12]
MIQALRGLFVLAKEIKMDILMTLIFLVVMIGIGMRGLPFWAWVVLVHESKRGRR